MCIYKLQFLLISKNQLPYLNVIEYYRTILSLTKFLPILCQSAPYFLKYCNFAVKTDSEVVLAVIKISVALSENRPALYFLFF